MQQYAGPSSKFLKRVHYNLEELYALQTLNMYIKLKYVYINDEIHYGKVILKLNDTTWSTNLRYELHAS